MRARSNVWKGLAAGAAGGLVASVVMNQFQSLLGKLVMAEERSHGAQSLQQGSPDHGVARELKERGSDDEQDDAAMRLANAISKGVFDHELNRREKKVRLRIDNRGGAASRAPVTLAYSKWDAVLFALNDCDV